MTLLQNLDVHILLCVWKEHNEYRFICMSDRDDVRSNDLLDYVLAESGLIKESGSTAYGRIPATRMLFLISDNDVKSALEFLTKSMILYFGECEIIVADEYAAAHRNELNSLKRYNKKQIPWAFVKSVDIAPAGTTLKINTLENENGSDVVTDENTYIMIGVQGEVYQIFKQKFESNYRETDEPFDIFVNMSVFMPEVKVLPEGKYINIDEMAKLCYPKDGAGIYARELTRRTKVFPVYDKKNYFLGRSGDYMAVRADDLSDIYIIKKQIFNQTYEEAE